MSRSAPLPRLLTLAAALALPALVARPAGAELIIKRPGDHPHYALELEPHLALDPGGGGAFGPGVRGTFVVVDNGFIETINNSVGVGVGLDLLFYDDGRCGPRHRDCGGAGAIVPLVMQWNFFLHPRWSV
ncbi:MAG: hypothetical protein FJ104_14030, partial [Deltaproteobacteria bacterium]|nr:hypothetical protein [Deltaproteobacteria bacterium]